MSTFRFRSTALSRSVVSSSFWSAVDRPGLEGQSRLATVAIHAPRISRKGLGGLVSAGFLVAAAQAEFRNANSPRAVRKARTAAPADRLDTRLRNLIGSGSIDLGRNTVNAFGE